MEKKEKLFIVVVVFVWILMKSIIGTILKHFR